MSLNIPTTCQSPVMGRMFSSVIMGRISMIKTAGLLEGINSWFSTCTLPRGPHHPWLETILQKQVNFNWDAELSNKWIWKPVYVDQQIKLTWYFIFKNSRKNACFVVLYNNLLLTDWKMFLRLCSWKISCPHWNNSCIPVACKVQFDFSMFWSQ